MEKAWKMAAFLNAHFVALFGSKSYNTYQKRKNTQKRINNVSLIVIFTKDIELHKCRIVQNVEMSSEFKIYIV